MRRGWLVLGLGSVLAGCGSTDLGSGGGAPPTSIVGTVTPIVSAASAPSTTLPGTASTTVTAPAPVPPLTVPIPTTPAITLLDGAWRVVSGVIGGEPVVLTDGAPITLTIAGEQASGTAACNSYDAQILVDETSVRFASASRTEIGCEQALMDLEAAFIATLGPEPMTYTLDKGSLTLATPTASWVFEPVPPTPDAELVGTVWQLDGLIDEFGMSWGIEMESATLVLAGDGTITGSTSCRPFTGTWTLSGGVIEFSDLTLSGVCDGVAADNERPELDVLGDAVTFEIDGPLMTLMSLSQPDVGLRYRSP